MQAVTESAGQKEEAMTEESRPSVDLFKAIFASSSDEKSSDSEEEEGDGEEEPAAATEPDLESRKQHVPPHSIDDGVGAGFDAF